MTYQQEQEAKRAAKRKVAKRFTFNAVGLDKFDTARPVGHIPADGTVVVKTQPYGCPKNGTMGHCYIEDAQDGTFYGLVLLASLTPVTK